jgi:hypothetical protein
MTDVREISEHGAKQCRQTTEQAKGNWDGVGDRSTVLSTPGRRAVRADTQDMGRWQNVVTDTGACSGRFFLGFWPWNEGPLKLPQSRVGTALGREGGRLWPRGINGKAEAHSSSMAPSPLLLGPSGIS